MSTDVAKPGQSPSTEALSPEEADQVASRIRPSWELEEGDLGDDLPPALAAAPVVEKAALESKVVENKAADDKAAKPSVSRATPQAPTPKAATPNGAITKESASLAGSDIPRDTVIDGMPTVGVGKTDPGPDPTAKASVKKAPPKPAAPVKAQPTRVGLGDDDVSESDAAPAIVSSKIVSVGDEASEKVEVRSKPPRPLSSSDRAKNGDTLESLGVESKPHPEESKLVTEEAAPLDLSAEAHEEEPVAPPRPSKKSSDLPLPPSRASRSRSGEGRPSRGPARETPVAPEKVSYSRADDPIELPVQKSSKTVIYGLIGAVVVAAGICAAVVFSGNDPAKTDSTSKPETKTESPKSEPTATAASTAHAETPPAKTNEPAAATPPAETAAPVAATPPAETAKPGEAPKPQGQQAANGSNGSGTKPPPAAPPPAGAPKKPPSKGGGGIIRDVPF